jgi:hypothetical protein
VNRGRTAAAQKALDASPRTWRSMVERLTWVPPRTSEEIGLHVGSTSLPKGSLRRAHACNCPRMLGVWPSGEPDTAARQAFTTGTMAGQGRYHWVAGPVSCTATQTDECHSGERPHG